ncbi:MAG: prolyl oligopeptidase family serine peptidase [Planctomycetota bacterium]|nr:prolyl oligopeptidase family serine peptidase [Planctomycetota bacterium]
MSGGAAINPRFAELPEALRRQSVTASLGGVPALLAHPEAGWQEAGARPAARPVMIWMHGRTVNKELDPGRYLRWIRAAGGGIAACALDLPGHGERFDAARQGSDATLEIVEQMAREVDSVVEALGEARWRGAFDLSRVGIGGMSAGGMVTLVRLTRAHSFRCAAVEATAGDFDMMSHFVAFSTRGGRDPERRLARALNPVAHLEAWRPVPLLALHSEADEWVPIAAIRSLVEELKKRYAAAGADAETVELKTWERTGAPNEHAGFGRVASAAKDAQLAFLQKWLAG